MTLTEQLQAWANQSHAMRLKRIELRERIRLLDQQIEDEDDEILLDANKTDSVVDTTIYPEDIALQEAELRADYAKLEKITTRARVEIEVRRASAERGEKLTESTALAYVNSDERVYNVEVALIDTTNQVMICRSQSERARHDRYKSEQEERANQRAGMSDDTTQSKYSPKVEKLVHSQDLAKFELQQVEATIEHWQDIGMQLRLLVALETGAKVPIFLANEEQ